MPHLDLGARWRSTESSLRVRWAAHLDQADAARRIESLLRMHGHPISFEVFDRRFTLCEPQVPGVQGDPDIAVVLGEAECRLFYVAQRERGALSALFRPRSHPRCGTRLSGRAIGSTGPDYASEAVTHRDPS